MHLADNQRTNHGKLIADLLANKDRSKDKVGAGHLLTSIAELPLAAQATLDSTTFCLLVAPTSIVVSRITAVVNRRTKLRQALLTKDWCRY